MLKKIGIVLAVALVVILILASRQSDSFRVERTASIAAPPEKIFAQIDNFRNWAAWSPWDKIDPSMKKTYSGPVSGKGTTYAWEGNGQVGQGEMAILDEAAPTKIMIRLDFLKPFPGHNTAEFTLTPKGATTDVTWAMYGPVPFVGKIMHLFFNMDKMIGGNFETGLANLKSIAETGK